MDDLTILREVVLSDCPPDKAFWACNGTVCRNISELISNIEGMNEYVFSYHVNDDNNKNDFALWIRNVLKDRILAERLYAIREKDRYVDVIKERVKELANA